MIRTNGIIPLSTLAQHAFLRLLQAAVLVLAGFAALLAGVAERLFRVLNTHDRPTEFALRNGDYKTDRTVVYRATAQRTGQKSSTDLDFQHSDSMYRVHGQCTPPSGIDEDCRNCRNRHCKGCS